MKNLFEPADLHEIRQRIGNLRPDSNRQWGKMNPAQAIAHCSGGLDMAAGNLRPPRMFLGRIVGVVIKRMILRDDAPLRHNAPTIEGLVMKDDRDLAKERERLLSLVDRFAAAGPKGCTTHPHAFFGQLKPDEWAILMYKHLDHHLRQFGV